MSEIPNEISIEYADHLVGELLALERADLTQMRRSMHKLSDDDLRTIRDNIGRLRDAATNLTYDRKQPSRYRAGRAYRKKKLEALKLAGELD